MAVKKGKAKKKDDGPVSVEILTGFMIADGDSRKLCEAGEVLTLNAEAADQLIAKGVAKKVK